MKDQPQDYACEIELRPGEKLVLPPRLLEGVGPGRWLITIQPADNSGVPVRNHSAFLNGYAKEDEGLYDDHSGR